MTAGRRQQAAIWALAVGQTLGFASMFYLFAALVLSLHADLGWSKTLLAAGPTLAIILSALLAPLIGRLVDAGWSRALLAGGPVLGAVALALLARMQGEGTYLLAWALIGMAQAACLYEVCFAFLIRRLGAGPARSAIVRVTLIAGLASTLSFPAGAILSEALGWRGAVWVAAGVVLFLKAPINWWAAGVIREGSPVRSPQGAAEDRAALRRALRRRAFWVLTLVISLIALNHWMMIAFLVPALVDLGTGERLAVLAAALIGPAQVAGRILLMRYEARVGNRTVLALCLAGFGIAAAILLVAGLEPRLAVFYALFQGAAIGVVTILKPVLISDVLGPEGYGSIAGAVQVAPILAGAAAPMLGAVILTGAGVSGLILVSGGLVGLSVLAALWLRRV